MSAVSSTFGAHESEHSVECAISLSLNNCHSNPRLARNRFRSGTQSDPCISSVTTAIMITTSNSPVKGSGMPNQLLGVQRHTIAISGLSRVRTELPQLLVIPSLTPHPVQANRQFSRHGYLGDLPSPTQRQVKILTAPFRIAAHCDLGRLHQQEAQQRVALFRDVSQPSPLPAGLLQRHQSQIARDLLATLKPFRSPDDQYECQRRQRTNPQDASATAAPRDTAPLPARPLASARQSSESVGLATPADRVGVGSPTALTGTTPVAPAPLPATTASCSADLR